MRSMWIKFPTCVSLTYELLIPMIFFTKSKYKWCFAHLKIEYLHCVSESILLGCVVTTSQKPCMHAWCRENGSTLVNPIIKHQKASYRQAYWWPVKMDPPWWSFWDLHCQNARNRYYKTSKKWPWFGECYNHCNNAIRTNKWWSALLHLQVSADKWTTGVYFDLGYHWYSIIHWHAYEI